MRASCLVRVSHMLHPSRYVAPAVTRASPDPRTTLRTILENERVDTFEVRPMRMVRCPGETCSPGVASNASLLGCCHHPIRWFPLWEVKLLMRTKVVQQFRIHYTMYPTAPKLRKQTLPTDQFVLLHFKGVGSMWGTAFRSHKGYEPQGKLREWCAYTKPSNGWMKAAPSRDAFHRKFVEPYTNPRV